MSYFIPVKIMLFYLQIQFFASVVFTNTYEGQSGYYYYNLLEERSMC